jgi:hypothetical protein
MCCKLENTSKISIELCKILIGTHKSNQAADLPAENIVYLGKIKNDLKKKKYSTSLEL